MHVSFSKNQLGRKLGKKTGSIFWLNESQPRIMIFGTDPPLTLNSPGTVIPCPPPPPLWRPVPLREWWECRDCRRSRRAASGSAASKPSSPSLSLLTYRVYRIFGHQRNLDDSNQVLSPSCGSFKIKQSWIRESFTSPVRFVSVFVSNFVLLGSIKQAKKLEKNWKFQFFFSFLPNETNTKQTGLMNLSSDLNHYKMSLPEPVGRN